MNELCQAPNCRHDRDGNPDPRQTAGQAYLCRVCWNRMDQNVADLPSLWAELEHQLAPQGKRFLSEAVDGTRDPNIRLNLTVVDMRSHIPGVLASWCTLIAEERGLHGPSRMDVNHLATWLTRHTDWLAHQPFAGEAAGELDELHNKARSLAYPLRPELLYAGPCDNCRTDMNAKAGSIWVQCKVCSAEYEIAPRQERMRDQLEDHLGSSSYVAMVASGLGVKVSASTVRMWVKRSKLFPRHYQPVDGKMRPQYRVGDVVRVASGNCQYGELESEREKPQRAG